jgi:hypothetical protein
MILETFERNHNFFFFNMILFWGGKLCNRPQGFIQTHNVFIDWFIFPLDQQQNYKMLRKKEDNNTKKFHLDHGTHEGNN